MLTYSQNIRKTLMQALKSNTPLSNFYFAKIPVKAKQRCTSFESFVVKIKIKKTLMQPLKFNTALSNFYFSKIPVKAKQRCTGFESFAGKQPILTREVQQSSHGLSKGNNTNHKGDYCNPPIKNIERNLKTKKPPTDD